MTSPIDPIQLDTVERELLEQVESCADDVVQHEGIDDFVKNYCRVPDYAPYYYLNDHSKNAVDRIRLEGGDSGLALFLRRVVVSCLRRIEARIADADLPASLVQRYSVTCQRMADDLREQDDDYYQFENDKFVKDLCLVSLRMYPAGGRILEPMSGLPRSLLLKGGIGNLFGALGKVMFRSRGFKPFIQFHTHLRELDDFNEAGMNETYHRVADLLRARPASLGVFTGSWFNDPVVPEISPRLAYLTGIPLSAGAFVLPASIDESSTQSAISRSPTRRQLYEQGRYQPRVYILVWPRDRLLEWDRANRDSEMTRGR